MFPLTKWSCIELGLSPTLKETVKKLMKITETNNFEWTWVKKKKMKKLLFHKTFVRVMSKTKTKFFALNVSLFFIFVRYYRLVYLLLATYYLYLFWHLYCCTEQIGPMFLLVQRQIRAVTPVFVRTNTREEEKRIIVWLINFYCPSVNLNLWTSNVTLSPISINGAHCVILEKPFSLIQFIACWRDSLALSPRTRFS